jgi:hypothetical protein
MPKRSLALLAGKSGTQTEFHQIEQKKNATNE